MRRQDPMRALVTGWVLIALVLHGSGCASANRSARGPATQGVAATPAVVPNLFDVQRQVEHYIDSGQYDADVTRVAGEAQAYLEHRAAERRKITEHGYTILLTMGDQQSDLAGGYAERTFKLPNPVYFIP